MIPNQYWYYSFIVIGLGILLFTMYKKKKVGDILTFFLASVTYCFLGELIVLFMFQGYMYKPEIYNDPFKNNVIGHVIPNASLWGTLAVLVGAMKFRYRGIATITILFILTEILFLKLGLYEHRWWRFYLTGIASILYMTTVRIAYSRLEENYNSPLRFIMFLFLGIVVLHTPSIIYLLLDMQYFYLDLFNNKYRESILVGVLYHAFSSTVVVVSAYLLKSIFYRIITTIIIVFSLDVFLRSANIMILSNGLNIYEVLATSALSICCIILLEQYTWKKLKPLPNKSSSKSFGQTKP